MGNLSNEPGNKIAANLARYQELTAELTELSEIPQQHGDKVEQLNGESAVLQTARDELALLDIQQKQAYDEWQVTQRSVPGRLRAAFKGKEAAAAAASSNEHAYELAFNAGQDKRQRIAELEGMVAQTSEQEAALRVTHQRYDDLRASLLALYEDVFGGPTPHYPEEDAAEDAFVLSRDCVESLEQALAFERCVLGKYPALMECAERAERQFEKGTEYFPGDRSGRRLHHNEKGTDNYNRAREWEHRIHDLRTDIELFPGRLPERSLFAARLEEKRDYCKEFLVHLRAARQTVSNDVSSLSDRLAEAKNDMQHRRETLEEVRSLIMDGCVEEAGAGPAPPAYEHPPALEECAEDR